MHPFSAARGLFWVHSGTLIVVLNPNDVVFAEVAPGLDSMSSSRILPGFSSLYRSVHLLLNNVPTLQEESVSDYCSWSW